MTNNNIESTTNLLKEMVDIFPASACKCIDTFFNKPCVPSAPWRITGDIDCNTNRIITIGCANNDFQAIAAIGVNSADCQSLLNREEIADDDFISIFGELANTFIALLMDQEPFIFRFGILHQSVPVLYSKGMPFLPFVSGISGAVTVEEISMIKFGFSVDHCLYTKSDSK